MAKNYKKIAVLSGGMSIERDVSLISGKAVTKALLNLGYQAHNIDLNKDIFRQLDAIKPDVVFNALHGRYGEDGSIQGLLDIMGIKYTHSGLLASAVAMNKVLTKKILSYENILSPTGLTAKYDKILEVAEKFNRPYIIKPVSEGSSLGILINKENIKNKFSKKDLIKTDEFLIEEYIEGIEISVPILMDKALTVVELEPLTDFYNYENKYSPGKTNHYLPARIDDELTALAQENALKAHRTLNCSTVSRSDFRVDVKNKKLYFLEINTHPGLTPTSILPESAAKSAINFDQLVQIILENASCGS